MGDNDDENLELTRLFMEFEIDKLRKENEIKLKSLQATPVSKETAMVGYKSSILMSILTLTCGAGEVSQRCQGPWHRSQKGVIR